MFQQDVLLCCVLCHRELKDVRPRTKTQGSRLPIQKASNIWHKIFLQPSRGAEIRILIINHQCQQEQENPSASNTYCNKPQGLISTSRDQGGGVWRKASLQHPLCVTHQLCYPGHGGVPG